MANNMTEEIIRTEISIPGYNNTIMLLIFTSDFKSELSGEKLQLNWTYLETVTKTRLITMRSKPDYVEFVLL